VRLSKKRVGKKSEHHQLSGFVAERFRKHLRSHFNARQGHRSISGTHSPKGTAQVLSIQEAQSGSVPICASIANGKHIEPATHAH